MAVNCGYASIDERGKASGGKAGDQTGKEVKLAPWYNFGQDVVIRFKDEKLAKKAAECMKWLCETNYVGYNQAPGKRTSAYNALKKLKWKYKKLRTKTETDCSQLISTVLNCIGIKVSPNIWTGNMVSALKATGKFEFLTQARYLTSDRYLKVGDIILNQSSHVIMALENGRYYQKVSKPKGKYSGVYPQLPKKGYLSNGDTGIYVKRLQEFLKWYGVYDDVVDGSFGPNTKSAVEKFQLAENLTADGSFGPKSLSKAKNYKKGSE